MAKSGAGVFVDFHFTKECSVSNLAISGNVKIGLFNKTDPNLCRVEESDNKIGVGGFAARTVILQVRLFLMIFL